MVHQSQSHKGREHENCVSEAAELTAGGGETRARGPREKREGACGPARLRLRPDDARRPHRALRPDLRPLVDVVLVLHVRREAVEVRGVRRRRELAVHLEVGLHVRDARAEGGGLGEVRGDEAGDALRRRKRHGDVPCGTEEIRLKTGDAGTDCGSGRGRRHAGRTGAGPGAPWPNPRKLWVRGFTISSSVLGSSAAASTCLSSSAAFGSAYGAVVNCWLTRYGIRSRLTEVNSGLTARREERQDEDNRTRGRRDQCDSLYAISVILFPLLARAPDPAAAWGGEGRPVDGLDAQDKVVRI